MAGTEEYNSIRITIQRMENIFERKVVKKFFALEAVKWLYFN